MGENNSIHFNAFELSNQFPMMSTAARAQTQQGMIYSAEACLLGAGATGNLMLLNQTAPGWGNCQGQSSGNSAFSRQLPMDGHWASLLDNSTHTREDMSSSTHQKELEQPQQLTTSRQPFSCLTNVVVKKEAALANAKQEEKEFRTEFERNKYWERRARNNEAAKNSRTKRREREEHLGRRVAELEKENQRLREELAEEKRKNRTNLE
jgi:hypothetical protein